MFEEIHNKCLYVEVFIFKVAPEMEEQPKPKKERKR